MTVSVVSVAKYSSACVTKNMTRTIAITIFGISKWLKVTTLSKAVSKYSASLLANVSRRGIRVKRIRNNKKRITYKPNRSPNKVRSIYSILKSLKKSPTSVLKKGLADARSGTMIISSNSVIAADCMILLVRAVLEGYVFLMAFLILSVYAVLDVVSPPKKNVHGARSIVVNERR